MNTFKIIGISIQTTNKDGQSLIDLWQLWGTFYTQNIIAKIPNKISDEVYAVYTDYESNYTGKYTTIIGLQVSSIDEIPDWLVAREFESQKFKTFIAKWTMPEAVATTWQEIWKNDNELNRSYIYDYEVYWEKSQNWEDSEVDIYIGTK